MWNEAAWKRHLELLKDCEYTQTERDWCLHFSKNAIVFLNAETGQEFKQAFTKDEQIKIGYSDTLLCCQPLVKWPDGMRPAHYG